MFKKTNLLIGTNANEGLESLVNFLPEINGDSVRLQLSSQQLNTAFTRVFPGYGAVAIFILF